MLRPAADSRGSPNACMLQRAPNRTGRRTGVGPCRRQRRRRHEDIDLPARSCDTHSMASNVATRRSRPDHCQVCLVFARQTWRATCVECARKQRAADAARYEAATAAGLCTRSGCTEISSSENRAYCDVHRAQRLDAAAARRWRRVVRVVRS